MSARFEIVRTDAGWHSRFIARNGQTVWTTESYKHKRAALCAVDTLARWFSPTGQVWLSNVRMGGTQYVDLRYGSENHNMYMTAHKVEVRVIDERSKP